MKDRNRTKAHWFFQDLYFANIYFMPSWSNREVREFIQQQFCFDYERPLMGDARCIQVEDSDGAWGLIIHTRYDDLSPKSVAALSHECLHAANNILNRVGVKVEPGENDEAQTYLLQWIMAKCYAKMKGGK